MPHTMQCYPEPFQACWYARSALFTVTPRTQIQNRALAILETWVPSRNRMCT